MRTLSLVAALTFVVPATSAGIGPPETDDPVKVVRICHFENHIAPGPPFAEASTDGVPLARDYVIPFGVDGTAFCSVLEGEVLEVSVTAAVERHHVLLQSRIQGYPDQIAREDGDSPSP